MRDDTNTEQTPPAADGNASDRSSAYLIVVAGQRLGEMYKLTKAVTVIGRSDDVDLRLNDEGVSRRHAAIRLEGDCVTLSDLGSVNGTFCNGTRIANAIVLDDGDKIALGGVTVVKFTYQDDLEEVFSKNLYESAVKDGLTGLYNRRYFDERLRSELTFARRHEAPLALLLIDIDNFKNINDQRGHQAGDTLLQEIARRLSSGIRLDDVVARFGGEEFAVICRSTGAAEAIAVAERLRSTISSEITTVPGPRLRITASIGIAVAPTAEMATESDFVKAADAALYMAKHRGRDRIVVSGDESEIGL